LAVVIRHSVSGGIVLDGLLDDGDLLIDGGTTLLEVLVDEAARVAADNILGLPLDDWENVGDSALDERGHHLGEWFIPSEADGKTRVVQRAGSNLGNGNADGCAQHNSEVESQGSEEKSSWRDHLWKDSGNKSQFK
jgi:hypothetical protein